jgi:hypothetical protein
MSLSFANQSTFLSRVAPVNKKTRHEGGFF